MDLDKYPILKIYVREIEELRKWSRNLPLIFLIGGTCELILREIMDDEKIAMGRLISDAESKGKVTSKQAGLFDDIREYRNKYLHISSDKILDDYKYFHIKDGLLENVNEAVLNDFTEENLEKVVRDHISEDSKFIYSRFKQLMNLLS